MNSPRTKFSVVLLLFTFAVSAQLRSQVGDNNPTGPTGEFNGNVTTGGSYDPFTGNMTRGPITDISIAGAVSKYGLSYSRTWNSRDPDTLHGAWTSNYSWSIDSLEDMPPYTYTPLTYTVHFPDGRTEVFYGTGSNPLPGGPGIRERMQPYNGSICSLLLPDGGKIEFHVTKTLYNDPELIPPTWCSYDFQVQAIIDPYGQRTTYTYSPDGTTVTITEPAGRWIKLVYTTINYTQVLDHIQASDGRQVQYTYTSGALTGVTYYGDNSLRATYTYANGLLKTCDDPMYAGPMKRIGYIYKTGTNTDGSTAVAGQILSENYYDGVNPNNLGPAVTTLDITTTTTRTETRADTKTRTFAYDGSGFLTSVTDFKGVSVSKAYDSYGFVYALTDRNGHTTNFTNNVVGEVTQMQYPATPGDAPAGRGTLNYTYGWASCPDVNNRDASKPYYPYSITDEGGNATIFTRDTSKRVTRVDYPDGGYETFTYNSFGQVLNHVKTTGGTETFSYDSRGLQLTYRDAYHASGNPNAWYQYDALDRVSGITDALGSVSGDVNHTTGYAYNNRGQLTTTTHPVDPIDGQRHTITNAYNSDGTLASTTDELGHVTSFTSDDYKRLLTKTTPQRAGGDNTQRITYSYYDANGTGNDYTHTDSNVTHLTLPGGNKTTTAYDENFHKTSVIIADGSADAAKTAYGYDNVGNVTSITAPDEQTGQPNAGKSTTGAYDERNRLMCVTDALGKPTSITYDAAGRTKTVTRPNGQVVTSDSFDAMNRLLQQTLKQTPNPDAVTKYTYFTSGLVKTMQDPHLVALNSAYNYSGSYDLMGRPTGVTYPPDSGSVQRTEAWHYDTAGRVDTFTNRAGNIQTFTYDALNRTTGFSWNDSGVTPNVTFGYDIANRLTNATNTIGSNTIATISRTYLNDNLLNAETESITGASSNTVTYTYDANGNRGTIQYPGNAYSFTYNYTGRNQLQTVVNNLQPGTVATYGYDVNGNLTSRALDNSTSSSYGYDALNRVLSISHTLNGGPRTLAYDYDPVGNKKWVKRDGTNGDVYGYDLNDQATATQLNISNPDTTPVGNQTISNDANGNRTTFAAYGPTDTYTTNNLNQYSARNSSQATYDNNGNMTTGLDGSTYNYDAQNRLRSASKAGTTETFTYDALNRQVSRTLSGVTTYNVWDGWDLIEEYQSGGSVNAAYLSGTGGLVKNLVTNRYYYQDGNGSTSHLADNAGHLLEWYRYDLQGTPVFYNASDSQISSSAYGVRHLFTGQQWYSELGLYDLRNRSYSPDMGRFLQPDPIRFAGDAGNIYRYCGNNPINRRDPSGLGPLLVPKQLFLDQDSSETERVTVIGNPVPTADTSDYSNHDFSAFDGVVGVASNTGDGGVEYKGNPELLHNPFAPPPTPPPRPPQNLRPKLKGRPETLPDIFPNVPEFRGLPLDYYPFLKGYGTELDPFYNPYDYDMG